MSSARVINQPAVMAGLDPAIHESAARRLGVDARDKRGHDAHVFVRVEA